MGAPSLDRDVITEEAIAWVHRIEKDGSDACLAEFVQWLKQSDLHGELFELMAALHEGLKRYGPDPASIHAALSQGVFARWVETLSGLLRPAGLALALAVVLALAVLIPNVRPWMDRLTTSDEVLIAPPKAGDSIVLRDGSTLHLSASAQARMIVQRHSREFRLESGNALIAVARDPSRPFLLTSGSFEIRDLGTRLMVSRQQTGISVLVLDGRVRLTAACGTSESGIATPTLLVDLEENQEIAVPGEMCARQTSVRTLQQPEIDHRIAWTLHPFDFNRKTLLAAAELFNRYNALQLKVDPAIANRVVSGHFTVTDPEGFIHGIEKSHGVRISAVSPRTVHSDVIYVVDSGPGTGVKQ